MPVAGWNTVIGQNVNAINLEKGLYKVWQRWKKMDMEVSLLLYLSYLRENRVGHFIFHIWEAIDPN